MTEEILVYWILPFLISLAISIEVFEKTKAISQWNSEDWAIVLFSCLLWPIAVIILLLSKESGFIKFIIEPITYNSIKLVVKERWYLILLCTIYPAFLYFYL